MMKTRGSAFSKADAARNAHFFDIVNGFFKIDAVVHVDRLGGVCPVAVGLTRIHNQSG